MMSAPALRSRMASMAGGSERRIGLWLFSVGFGTNVPIPLLLVYQDRLGLTQSAVTGLFGVYAVGLVPALFVAGPVADRWGRRSIALPAVFGAALVSGLFMLAAGSVEFLFVARFLQGVVSGAAFSVGSAWLVEAAARNGSRTGSRTAAVSMTAGFSGGSFVSGLLGEWAPAPLFLSYALHIVLSVTAIAAVWHVRETLSRSVRRRSQARVRIFRPDTGVAGVFALMALAVCIYGFPASAINGVPILVGFPVFPVAATGLLSGLTLAAGALAAPTRPRLGDRAGIVAAACGIVGFGAVAAAAALPALILMVVPGAVLLGAGGGLALAVSLHRISRIATPAKLGTAAAILYACAYVGFGAPFVIAAIAGSVPVVVSFVTLAGVCALLMWQQSRAKI